MNHILTRLCKVENLTLRLVFSFKTTLLARFGSLGFPSLPVTGAVNSLDDASRSYGAWS